MADRLFLILRVPVELELGAGRPTRDCLSLRYGCRLVALGVFGGAQRPAGGSDRDDGSRWIDPASHFDLCAYGDHSVSVRHGAITSASFEDARPPHQYLP